MAKLKTVTGVDGILKRLRSAKTLVDKGFEIGLKRAGVFLQRESQLIVPVDVGNLKGSAFTRSEGSGTETEVTVGYTAAYAIFVHERTELTHKPGKQAKFLEEPMRSKRDQILNIIEKEAQL